jgi:hypothetical protein
MDFRMNSRASKVAVAQALLAIETVNGIFKLHDEILR